MQPGDWVLVGPGDYHAQMDYATRPGGQRRAGRGAGHGREHPHPRHEPQQRHRRRHQARHAACCAAPRGPGLRSASTARPQRPQRVIEARSTASASRTSPSATSSAAGQTPATRSGGTAATAAARSGWHTYWRQLPDRDHRRTTSGDDTAGAVRHLRRATRDGPGSIEPHLREQLQRLRLLHRRLPGLQRRHRPRPGRSTTRSATRAPTPAATSSSRTPSSTTTRTASTPTARTTTTRRRRRTAPARAARRPDRARTRAGCS